MARKVANSRVLPNPLPVIIGAVVLLFLSLFLIIFCYRMVTFENQQKYTLEIQKDVERILDTNYTETVQALTKQQSILKLFSNADQTDIQNANMTLNATRDILGVDLIFILDTRGTIIASSLSKDMRSFIGQSYYFRPYFTEAMKGNDYQYVALGIATQKRGIYFSTPIRNTDKQIVGVGVIKTNTNAIDKIIFKAAAMGPIALSTENDVIFASTEDKWLFHTTRPLQEQEKEQLVVSRQFGSKKLTPLSFDIKNRFVTYSKTPYSCLSLHFEKSGWEIFSLVPQKTPLTLIIIACLIFTIPLFLFLARLNHFHRELRYKDHINKQNKHLKRLSNEVQREIEERQDTENKLFHLSEQELRYRLLFQQSKDAITIISDDGRFLETNQAFLSMMDTDADEIRSLSPCDFWFDRDDEAYWLRLVKEQGSVIDYHCKLITRKDVVLNFNLTTTMIKDSNGNTYYLNILRDITDKLLDKKELIAAKTAAEQASQAKSNFLANMSHEIRTPMNGIIGMTDIVLNSDLDSQQRNYLEMVKLSADRLLGIINNILDFSKIEAGRLELEEIPFNLKEKINELVSLMQIKAEDKNVELATHISPDIPIELVGDPNRLLQILINLTNNAIKFTTEGSVTIDIEREKQLSPSRILLRFNIIDTGVGIPLEKHQEIFESFSQADSSTTRQFGGTGLGLTISSQLCHLMDGNIGLESERNHGAHFWFTASFNLAQQEEEKGEKQVHGTILGSQLSRAEIFQNIRILLAEDDRINRTLAMAILEKAGLSVTISENGAETVHKAQTNNFNLILMDIQMPEMDGYEATRRIREEEKRNGHHVPIIAMTAHAIIGDREKCLTSGMDDYITKPIEPSALYAVIEKHLLRRALIADQDLKSRQNAGKIFTEMGWHAVLVETSKQCLWECDNSIFDLIILDLDSKINPSTVISVVTKKAHETGRIPLIIATASSPPSSPQENSTLQGLYKILPKPITKEMLSPHLFEV